MQLLRLDRAGVPVARAPARRRPGDESSPAPERGADAAGGGSAACVGRSSATGSRRRFSSRPGSASKRASLAVERGIVMALLALLPVLAVALGRSLLVVAASTALSLLVALAVAVDLPLSNARPFDARDFFGPAVDSFRKGFLEFFDTRVPFDAAALPDMEAVILLGIFAFALAVGIAIATRRTFLAVGLLAAGCGWPTTMLSLGATSNRDLVLGALILVTAFVLLALLRPGSRSLVPATRARARARRRRGRRRHERRGRQGRVRGLEPLGSVRPPRRSRGRELRLERQLRRHQVPGQANRRAAHQDVGPAALPLLARDHARHLHGQRLAARTSSAPRWFPPASR